jgi:hypothetical protein
LYLFGISEYHWIVILEQNYVMTLEAPEHLGILIPFL